MTDASDRREAVALKVASMRGIIDHVVSLDGETTLAKLESVTRERLSSPRMMPRLAMRRARRIAPQLFTPALDDRELLILSGGPEAIEALIVLSGTHAHWEEVIRLVQRSEQEALDAQLGVASRSVALRGRQHDLGLALTDQATDDSPLVERILNEGALCWACWLSALNPAAARRLRVLTPERVSERITGRSAGTAEHRKLRRQAVDVEIDELVRLATTELEQGEAA